MGVRTLFNHGARLYPDRKCLDDGRLSLTFRQAHALSRRIGAALQAEGAGPGAKCALLSPNCAEAMLAILGIYQANAVFTPLNGSLPAAEQAAAANQLGVTALFFHSRYAAAARTILAGCPTIIVAVCVDDQAGLGEPWTAWLKRHATAELEEGVARPDDLVAIYPTGGSTGLPKRVMHTRRVWDTMAAAFLTSLPITEPATFLIAPPITHAAGTYAMMMMPAGATTVILDGFDAGAVLEAIERHRVSHLFLPPTAIYKMLEHPEVGSRDLSSLRAFIYTAAPMSVEKLRECIKVFGPVMVQFWGQTEAPCFCTCLTAQDHVVDNPALAQRLASCGREAMFVQVEVMDEEGGLLPAGERGELVVRSNLVMAGYYQNPEATAEASRFGWHHTGDTGFKDPDGYVYIVGRMSDMIITGGYNVYPADVEQVLSSHPAVGECAVIGVPDELWGEAVLAVVELKQGCEVEAAELIAFCKARLGAVRTPKRVEIRVTIPHNAIGKVDKPALRKPYWEGRSRMV